MSVWQFYAALNGVIEANSRTEGGTLSEEEALDLFAWLETAPSEPRTLSTQTYWWTGSMPEPAGIVSFIVNPN